MVLMVLVLGEGDVAVVVVSDGGWERGWVRTVTLFPSSVPFSSLLFPSRCRVTQPWLVLVLWWVVVVVVDG